MKTRIPAWLARIAVLVLTVPGTSSGQPAPEAPSLPQPVKAEYLEVAGGRLFYEVFGSGFPLVFIHDGLAHREVWDAQVSAFAGGYRVVRYDRRGYGRSDAPETLYSDIDDLQALLDHLEISRAVLIGSSAGGGLAIDFALQHPESVEALVLVGPVVSGLGYSFHFLQRAYENFAESEEETRNRWVEDRYTVAAGNDAARARLRQLMEAFPQNLDFAKYRLLQQPQLPALERLSEIAVPTLIVAAENDIPDVHAHVGAIEAGIRGAVRVVLDDAGHLCYLEQPAAFDRELSELLSLISLEPGSPRALAEPPPPWDGFERGFVPVPGGHLYYEQMGSGEALVLIHGGAIDHRMWDDQVAVFAERFRVIRYDVRGHGLSRATYGERRNFEDLRRLLDHLGLARAHLVGLSLGGRIVVDFAIAYPERTASLIAVSPGISGYQFEGEDEVASREAFREAWGRLDWEGVADAFLAGWTVGPRREREDVEPAVYDRQRRMALENVRPGKDSGVNRELEPPAVGRLREIQAPTLALLGDLDMPAIHDIVGMIRDQVPGARIEIFERAAHMVNMEQPQRFNEVVLGFLAEVERSEPAPRE